jgi:hypothetical protein
MNKEWFMFSFFMNFHPSMFDICALAISDFYLNFVLLVKLSDN